MGVIRTISRSYSPSDEIENILDDIEGLQSPEPEVRRPRKIKRRTAKPSAIGGIVNDTKSGRRKRLIENTNYLMSLADGEESFDMKIEDIVPQTESLFSQVFLQTKEYDFIWNGFVECSDGEEWLKDIAEHFQDLQQPGTSAQLDVFTDGRSRHPAYYSVENPFNKLNSHHRNLLKKKTMNLGSLKRYEKELVTFFVNCPKSVFNTLIPDSYERLLLHAVSEYLNLISHSYEKGGDRWTKVVNKKPDFQLPSILLSSFLERRQRKSFN